MNRFLWILFFFLPFSPGTAFSESYANWSTMTVTASLLNIRSSPSFDGPIIDRVRKGSIVDAVETTSFTAHSDGIEDFWYWVHAPSGVSGWAFGGYLKYSSDAEPLEPLMKQACDFMRKKNYANALEWLVRWRKSCSGEKSAALTTGYDCRASALLLMAETYHAGGDMLQAKRLYRQTIQSHSKSKANLCCTHMGCSARSYLDGPADAIARIEIVDMEASDSPLAALVEIHEIVRRHPDVAYVTFEEEIGFFDVSAVNKISELNISSDVYKQALRKIIAGPSSRPSRATALGWLAAFERDHDSPKTALRHYMDILNSYEDVRFQSYDEAPKSPALMAAVEVLRLQKKVFQNDSALASIRVKALAVFEKTYAGFHETSKASALMAEIDELAGVNKSEK